MQASRIAVSVVLLLSSALSLVEAAVAKEHTEVSPVQKVIQLLNSMLEKGKSEKHQEQVQFAAYKQFCDDTTAEKKRAVDQAAEMIEKLEADIQKYTVDAEMLTKEIAGHDQDIAVWAADEKAASKVRTIEKTDYDALHKDYTESVDAIRQAVQILQKQAYDRPQTAMLQRVSALKGLSLIPDSAKKVLDTFLQQTEDPAAEGLEVTAPESTAYEFQSHGVIEMLEKLLDKFIDERTGIEKQELNSRHAYDMLMQDLKAQRDQATLDRGQKAETKAKKLQAKADAQGLLTDTTATRDADSKYLTDLKAVCSQKTTDFESRQQLRADELVAIEKAIEILSNEVLPVETRMPTLVQKKAGSSLALLRADSNSQVQTRAANYLDKQAQRLNSRVLAALATHVSEDPFAKVKKMIKDLIVRLMEEANEEAEHKGWCDTELATNEQTRSAKTSAVETLHAEIDSLQASIAELTDDVAELTAAIAQLDVDMAEATRLRNAERATNNQTIQDADEAEQAVARALVVLKEFYATAGEATALVQNKKRQEPVPPPIFDSPYTGMQGENTGVIGMLEVIESDFARLQSDTKADDATAQKEYDKFMTDSKVDKAAKKVDMEHKTSKKQDESQSLTVKKADLELTQKELDAALAYFEKLKPSCVDAGVSYEERVTRRKEEIESLQEALRILNGEDITA